MNIKNIPRVFKFNGKEIADPNPALTPDEVVSLLMNEYPAMTNAKVESKGISDDKDIYDINTKMGTKG